MAIGSGLAAQIGLVKETTPNTPVAVTTFTKLLSESLKARPNYAQDYGLGGDLVALAARRQLVSVDAGGDVDFNVPNKGFGKWVQMALGSTPTATQISTTGAYTQFHLQGSSDGTKWTVQKGIPSRDGTVNPFTLGGTTCVGWELSCAPNGLLHFKATLDAMSIAPVGASALALQTASYTATAGFGFNNVAFSSFAAMTVVSSLWTPTSPVALKVRNMSIKGGQPKKTDSWLMGSTTKDEQLGNAFTPITGSIDIDYAANTYYSAMLANTSIGFQASATGAITGTSGTNVSTVQVTLPACFIEDGTPTASGPDVVTVSYPFTAESDGTNGAIQIYIISSDAAV